MEVIPYFGCTLEEAGLAEPPKKTPKAKEIAKILEEDTPKSE